MLLLLYYYISGEKIDGMAFTLMKPDIIKSMFPQMGPQLKLIHLHQQLIASQSTSITHDACLSVDQRVSKKLQVIVHFMHGIIGATCTSWTSKTDSAWIIHVYPT